MIAHQLRQHARVRSLILSKQQDSRNILAAGAKLPICVIHGAKDKHLNVHKVEKFAKEKFGQIELHAINETGHMSFYECPEKKSQLILDFLRRIGA